MDNKIFIMIIVLAVITGCTGAGLKPATKNPDVRIVMDKTEFFPGENITARLEYSGTVYSKNRWMDLFMLQNDSWIRVDGIYGRGSFACDNMMACDDVNFTHPMPECLGIVDCQIILPEWAVLDYKINFYWDQTMKVGEKKYDCAGVNDRTCVIFGQAPPGRYKLEFDYATKVLMNKTASWNSKALNNFSVEKEFEILWYQNNISENCTDAIKKEHPHNYPVILNQSTFFYQRGLIDLNFNKSLDEAEIREIVNSNNATLVWYYDFSNVSNYKSATVEIPKGREVEYWCMFKENPDVLSVDFAPGPTELP